MVIEVSLVEPIAQGEKRLVVVLRLPAVRCHSAAEEVMRGEGPVETSVDESRPCLGSERRHEVLSTGLRREPQGFAHVAGQRYGLIVALPKGAVEVRVMQVGPYTGMPYVAHGESVHLVPGAFRVAGPVALADGGIETAAERQVEVHAAADSLKEQLVEQSGAHQSRVEGRKAAEVI